MKFSTPVLGLLLAVAPSTWATTCDSGSYSPTDTAEQCFPLTATADPTASWGGGRATPWEPDAGEVCISVTGDVMSLTFSTIMYWHVFNYQIFLGDSILNVPMNDDGSLNLDAFTASGDEPTGVGNTDADEGSNNGALTVTINLSDINFPMDATQCAASGSTAKVIMPHAKVADVCEAPFTTGNPTAWYYQTDYPATAGDQVTAEGNYYLDMGINCACDESTGDKSSFNTPTKETPSGSGDPHFKTWTGDKFDYHGECDLVLVDNPTFADGLGLTIHIRTTRIKYFSYIEKIAIQIGQDVLEFSNNVETFLINGKPVDEEQRRHKTYLGGYVVRRDQKALSIRLAGGKKNKHGGPKIDLVARNIGFPAVILDGADTDIFRGSLGLLGEWETGKKIARDGKLEMNHEDATDFALEWQVRDTEPLLFLDARAPQFPTQCTPPSKNLGNRLGMKLAREEAAKACAAWTHDQEDCIFDVIATRDVSVAAEGSIFGMAAY